MSQQLEKLMNEADALMKEASKLPPSLVLIGTLGLIQKVIIMLDSESTARMMQGASGHGY